MIAFREKYEDLDTIRDLHRDCVLPYVRRMIGFYIDVFKYLPKIVDKRPDKKAVIKKIKEIRDKHECSHYKRLLKGLMVKKITLEKEDDLVNLIYLDSYLTPAKTHGAVSIALADLLLNCEAIICIDLCKNPKEQTALYNYWKATYTPIKFLLELIFDYQGWFLKLPVNAAWGPYQLVMKLDIRSCPYCNRQYTFSLVNDMGKKLGRPELDHFLPKSINPLLALSFYNLIPSCKGCNSSSLKGSTDTAYDRHLSPYELNSRNGLMRFTYIPLSYEASVGISEELQIELKYSGDPPDLLMQKKVEGNIVMFALDEIYKNHTDIVQEIIRKRHDSNDRYIQTLQSTFKGFPVSVEDAYRLAFGNYYREKEFHKRPLAKLTKDMAIELKAIVKFKP
jgi:hypothetical protein